MIDELHPVTQDKQMVECPDCRGNGFIESRVPLEEAIIDLACHNPIIRPLITG